MSGRRFSAKVPRGSRWGVFTQWLGGLVRRLRRRLPDAPPDSERVRYYFMARSATSGFGDFLDAATPWYVEWLAQSRSIPEKLKDAAMVRILDYGFGQGGLTRWVLNVRGSRPTRYLGVDLNDAAVARGRELFPPTLAEFKVHDAAQPEPADWGAFDAIFVVNLLPYLADPAPFLARLRSRLAERRSILVVVDPVPSAYWDVDFGTFRAILRPPADIADLAAEAGYTAIERGTLHGISLLGLPALPLAACAVFHPAGE